MTFEAQVAARIRRVTADAAARFAFDHGLSVRAEAQLHALLKDSACEGISGGRDLVLHQFKTRNHD